MEPNYKFMIKVFLTLMKDFNGAGPKLILKRKWTLITDLPIGDIVLILLNLRKNIEL
jgi:hypothetical protein